MSFLGLLFHSFFYLLFCDLGLGCCFMLCCCLYVAIYDDYLRFISHGDCTLRLCLLLTITRFLQYIVLWTNYSCRIAHVLRYMTIILRWFDIWKWRTDRVRQAYLWEGQLVRVIIDHIVPVSSHRWLATCRRDCLPILVFPALAVDGDGLGDLLGPIHECHVRVLPSEQLDRSILCFNIFRSW